MPEQPSAIPTPPATPVPVSVRMKFDRDNRAVHMAAMRKFDLAPVEFALSFAVIKQLAAQILTIEAQAEIQHAQKGGVVVPT